MDNLTYQLRQLCGRNRDGAYSTQHDRLQMLTLISRQLLEMGFRHMRADSLKRKHVVALVERWQCEGLTTGTIKNRMVYLRWWAEKAGRSNEIPAENAGFGIPQRLYVTNENKAKQLGAALDLVGDPYVRMGLELQANFGLRRAESIKFVPREADRGDRIELGGPWAKGGRGREVMITTAGQREVLNRAHELAGSGSLIPSHKTFKQQRNTYDAQCQQAGLHKMHGLRHAYAQTRYEVLTGRKAPAAGGPSVRSLSREQRAEDRQARQTISRELGHERLAVVAIYVGR